MNKDTEVQIKWAVDDEGYFTETCPHCGETKRVYILGCLVKADSSLTDNQWQLAINTVVSGEDE